jgi:hypothetical protein
VAAIEAVGRSRTANEMTRQSSAAVPRPAFHGSAASYARPARHGGLVVGQFEVASGFLSWAGCLAIGEEVAVPQSDGVLNGFGWVGLSRLSGRGIGFPTPPPQIPACGLPAPGSCRKSDAIDVRGLGGPSSFDPRVDASCDTPDPALCPGRASASTASSGRVPSLHTLRRHSSWPCSDASTVVWTRPTPPAFRAGYAHPSFPARPGTVLAAAGGRRPPRFRRVPFLRDVASDPGRATGPRIAAPHILPSAPLTASAPAA